MNVLIFPFDSYITHMNKVSVFNIWVIYASNFSFFKFPCSWKWNYKVQLKKTLWEREIPEKLPLSFFIWYNYMSPSYTLNKEYLKKVHHHTQLYWMPPVVNILHLETHFLLLFHFFPANKLGLKRVCAL